MTLKQPCIKQVVYSAYGVKDAKTLKKRYDISLDMRYKASWLQLALEAASSVNLVTVDGDGDVLVIAPTKKRSWLPRIIASVVDKCFSVVRFLPMRMTEKLAYQG